MLLFKIQQQVIDYYKSAVTWTDADRSALLPPPAASATGSAEPTLVPAGRPNDATTAAPACAAVSDELAAMRA